MPKHGLKWFHFVAYAFGVFGQNITATSYTSYSSKLQSVNNYFVYSSLKRKILSSFTIPMIVMLNILWPSFYLSSIWYSSKHVHLCKQRSISDRTHQESTSNLQASQLLRCTNCLKMQCPSLLHQFPGQQQIRSILHNTTYVL